MLAGRLRFKIAFDRRSVTDDGFGNLRGDWVNQFTLWADKIYRAGTERTEAGALVPTQTAQIILRNSSTSRQITADWRARDTKTGEAFNIRSIRPGNDRNEPLILECEKEVTQ